MRGVLPTEVALMANTGSTCGGKGTVTSASVRRKRGLWQGTTAGHQDCPRGWPHHTLGPARPTGKSREQRGDQRSGGCAGRGEGRGQRDRQAEPAAAQDGKTLERQTSPGRAVAPSGRGKAVVRGAPQAGSQQPAVQAPAMSPPRSPEAWGQVAGHSWPQQPFPSVVPPVPITAGG